MDAIDFGYGPRADGTQKGAGYFGPLPTLGGGVMTELGIGVNLGGKETEIPTVVPTLTPDQRQYLQNGGAPTDDIVRAAVAHAIMRLRQGQSQWASPYEALPPQMFNNNGMGIMSQYMNGVLP